MFPGNPSTAIIEGRDVCMREVKGRAGTEQITIMIPLTFQRGRDSQPYLAPLILFKGVDPI